MKEVKKERTYWRDSGLSERHRKYGWNCPAVDIDFLLIEYDKGKAVALVEYKNELAIPQYASHPSYMAIIDLGNKANIPVFACRYASDFSWFKVVPLNSIAKTKINNTIIMNEHEYISFLYQLRGYKVHPELFTSLDIVI
jgi:hypothetical protein